MDLTREGTGDGPEFLKPAQLFLQTARNLPTLSFFTRIILDLVGVLWNASSWRGDRSLSQASVVSASCAVYGRAENCLLN